MTGLETKVREDLINQRADELVRYASENPEYKAMAAELVETMIDSMTGSMASAFGDVDEEETSFNRHKVH